MKFRIKADAVFEAEGIDDAFTRLSEHFWELYSLDLDEQEEFLLSGYIDVHKDGEPA